MTETTEATPNLSDVAEMEARVTEAREVLSELEERKGEITDELAELHAEGKGNGKRARKLRERRREVLQREDELQAALPLLEEKITEKREATCRALAFERLRTIGTQLKDNTEVHPDRVKDLTDTAEELAFQAERINNAFENQQTLVTEARALVERFPGLELPEFEEIDPPGRLDDVREVLDITMRLRFPVRTGRRSTRSRPGPDSETGKILAEAGERPDFTFSPEQLKARREAEKREHEREERKRRQEERARKELDRFTGHGGQARF